MPFCPKCTYEYKANINECPDCGEQLVDSLPEPTEFRDEEVDPDKEWIELARLTSNQYAEMVVEALLAKDIPAIVHSKSGHYGYIGVMGPSSFASVGDGFLIMVPREFTEIADKEAELVLGDIWTRSRLEDQ